MPIEAPQHRPPQDLFTPMLQIVTGCTHGKCHFCDIYQGVPFAMAPREVILSDIDELAKQATALTRRIYLTGGNPFSLGTDKLLEVFDEVEARIPTVKSYGGFCRIMDVAAKNDDELAALAARGVDDIALGAESGYDGALAFMEKGHTAADIVEQAQRLHKAGISFTFFYLAGMAGTGKGQANAEASARVFSAADPRRILIVTLTPTKTWPLARDIAAGQWAPAAEVETAQEIRAFVAGLTCRCLIDCSHDTDIVRFEGAIPKDQENMLLLLDNRIPKMSERGANRVRQALHGASW